VLEQEFDQGMAVLEIAIAQSQTRLPHAIAGVYQQQRKGGVCHIPTVMKADDPNAVEKTRLTAQKRLAQFQAYRNLISEVDYFLHLLGVDESDWITQIQRISNLQESHNTEIKQFGKFLLELNSHLDEIFDLFNEHFDLEKNFQQWKAFWQDLSQDWSVSEALERLYQTLNASQTEAA
jgi:hypothetical protein